MSVDSGVKKRKAIIKDAQHCKRVAISLHNLNTTNVLHDVCFICNRGIKVEAHKLLLCTVSKQLKKMFLELPDTLDKIVIYLPDVDAHIMRLICDFLYEGSVKVKKNEFPYFQEVMDLLAIELSRPNSVDSASMSTTSQPLQQVQPVAAPQYLYFQAPANSQMQYMMAQPIPTGQVMPAPLMTPVVQGNVAQPSAQPMMIAQSNNQMVQAGAQMVNTQVQQMQVVSQNTNQVVPMMASNQMMPANQIVGGNQLVQCSNQMLVQGTQQPMITNNQLQTGNQQTIMNNNQMQTGNQQTIMNNNQMQTGIKSQSNYSNQSIQQSPQYVMSNSNQLTTSRAPRQVTMQRPSTNTVQRTSVGRGRNVQQPVTNTRLTNIRTRRMQRAPVPMVQNRTSINTGRMVQRNRNTVQ